METDNELEYAKDKLVRKNLDMIVVNNPRDHGAAFEAETNKVTILQADAPPETLPLMPKRELAVHIMNRIVELIKERQLP